MTLTGEKVRHQKLDIRRVQIVDSGYRKLPLQRVRGFLNKAKLVVSALDKSGLA